MNDPFHEYAQRLTDQSLWTIAEEWERYVTAGAIGDSSLRFCAQEARPSPAVPITSAMRDLAFSVYRELAMRGRRDGSSADTVAASNWYAGSGDQG